MDRAHSLDMLKVSAELETNLEHGLTDGEAESRIAKYGKNELAEGGGETLWHLIFKQLKSPLVLILIAAAAVSLFLHETSSFVVIMLTVAINVIIGVWQEGKAGKAFAELQKSQTKYATVIRSGLKHVVKAAGLVPGDLVVVESGNSVPADIRLKSADGLSINESALTGEWKDEEKSAEVLDSDTAISEQSNMVFMGTLVSYGAGTGIVVATAGNTEIGKIAKGLSRGERRTPLQDSVAKLARLLVALTVVVVVAVFALGIIRGETLGGMLLVAIALAVSAIPEGLPVAITVILVTGMKSILKKGGFVRSMLAAETLGSTTIILTDKTGTLTKGEMVVRKIITHGSEQSLEDAVIKYAVLASDAYVEKRDGVETVQGRPVEKAILAEGLERALDERLLHKHQSRVGFLKFESQRRFAASLDEGKDGKYFHISGAPETLLDAAGTILSGRNEKITLSREIKSEMLAHYDRESASGARLIGVAIKKTSLGRFPNEREVAEAVLQDCAFVGFISLEDAVREDAAESIAAARGAGARVIMMTGDHLGTGLSVARTVGIASDGDSGKTGKDIEAMNDKQLLDTLYKETVFARMLPEQKLRVAKLLQTNGEVVAMTGDGINDAPALRNANIGVALGSGTEVAKEASDLVLIDNRFSIIVSAIKEGRRLLDNIKKSVAFLLSTSFSEIILITGGLLIGLPLALLPKQILWENIVSGGLLNVIFAFEPAESDVMSRNPRGRSFKSIMTGRVRSFTTAASFVTGLLKLAAFWYLLRVLGMGIEEARTIIFILVSVDIFFMVFSFKSFVRPAWKAKLLENQYIIWGLLMAAAGVAVSLSVPALRSLLSISLPQSFPWVLVIGLSVSNLALIELCKWLIFRKETKPEASTGKLGNAVSLRV